MATYEHRQLVDNITRLDAMPSDAGEYAEWIKAGAHLDLLRRNALQDELIIYANGDYSYVHTVVVPEDALHPLNVGDLLDCSADPFQALASFCWGGGRDDVWIEQDAVFGRGPIKGGKQLLFARTVIESAERERLYYEVSQEYAHITEIHLLREHGAYCRFDMHGDLEHVVSLATKSTPEGVALVTFKRDPLEQYLAASSSVLLRKFDFTLLNRSAFTAWPDTPEDFVREGYLFFHQKVDGTRAAYTNGVQIILPRRSKTELFAKIKGTSFVDDPRHYAAFTALDWRNGRLTSISTDP